MASVNKVIIVGNLGADPEMRYLPSGDAVCQFRVATTDRYKDKQTGEMREATEWHSINAFSKLAEVCGEYLKKGSQVYVEGNLQTRKYTDKNGVEKYATSIRANTMQMLGSRQQAEGGERRAPAAQGQQRGAAPAQAPSGFDDMDSDIPF